MNKIFDDYVAKLKLEYYKIENIKCSVLLGEKVFFDKYGLRHLIRKDGHNRSVSQQRRRFELLRYCRHVLERTDADIEYRISENYKSKAEFWGITASIDGRKIRVVLRKINGGKLIFLSIMDYK